MWIFTKGRGSHNTEQIRKIEIIGTGTYVSYDNGVPVCISVSPVENVIRDAIRRGDNYVEVE